MHPLNNVHLRLFFCCLFLLLVQINIFGQASDLVFTHIDVTQGLSDNQVRYISQLPDGRMVFTTSGNINIYDGSRFKHIHRNPEDIYPLRNYDGFYRIYQGRDSILWIKDTQKLMCLDLKKEKYLPAIEQYVKKRRFDKQIDDLFLDAQQNIWLLSDNKLFDCDNRQEYNIAKENRKLQDLLADEKSLYLFFHTGELVCYDRSTKKKIAHSSAYQPAERDFFNHTSLAIEEGKFIYQLRNGQKGGFFRYDKETQNWQKLLETETWFNTLMIDSDRAAYISCSNGFWVIDLHTGEKRYTPTMKTVDGQFINTEISTLFRDQQGGLWLGTRNRGLLYQHASRYKFKYFGKSLFNQSNEGDLEVQKFAEDHQGDLFLKTSYGIYNYHPHALSGSQLQFVPNALVPKSIKQQFDKEKEDTIKVHDYQTTLFKDKRNWLWIGTQDGLIIRDLLKGTERKYYTNDGLPNNFIHAIIEDRNGYIWITTSYGISRVQVDTETDSLHLSSFNVHDGALKDEYINDAAFQADDGSLYFGGVNGFNVVDADNMPKVSLPFRPIFTKLYLNGETLKIDKKYDGRTILQKSTVFTDKLDLTYDQNFITLEYAALNFQNPERTHFRYKLEGIDKEWRYSSNPHLTIFYTNLPPGRFLLQVMSSSDNNTWTSSPTTLEITIRPPWWKTRIAYVSYCMFLLVIGALSIMIYNRNMRHKLEHQHKEELLLLRIRNLIEQRNLLEEERKPSKQIIDEKSTNVEESNPHSKEDTQFLTRAMACVEANLDVQDYSVEKLSQDLCMDRTGLYRKLITLLDKSPSLFIRSIRLQRAAQLIREGELTISEIADRVGFSSTSYFSKCFQEMYGCKPSIYDQKSKKST